MHLRPLSFSLPLLLAGFTLLPLSASEPDKHAGHSHASYPGVQSLDVTGAGSRLHLLTGESAKEGPQTELWHRSSCDAGATWSAPVRVGAGQQPPHAAHRGMDPQIAAAGDRALAVWMTPGTDPFGGGPMATAISTDGGATWKPGPNPADDGSTTGHGFIDVAADAAGNFHLTWLDTRNEKRGLRYTRSTDGGQTWSANETPDPETCECCWNTLATGPDGTVGILYRDKNPRDMAIAWAPQAGKPWPASIPVGGFGWQFEGCPHVGGGLAIGGEKGAPVWHASVWTGTEKNFGVHHLTSSDGGKSWSTTQQLGGKTASHPDLAARGSAEVALAWDVTDAHGSRIEAVLSTDAGKTWTKATELTGTGAIASHPRVVATPSGFRIFWTQRSADGPLTWKSATFPAPATSQHGAP